MYKSTLLIFVATDQEFQALSSMLGQWRPEKATPRRGTGWLADYQIDLVQTGMGPENAAHRSRTLLKHHPARTVLMCGIAGALSPQCQVGDAVLYTHCQSSARPDIQIKTTSSTTESIVSSLETGSIRTFQGTGVTLPRVVCRASEKVQIGSEYRALAIDMESYCVVENALQANRHVAVLRIISDDTRHDLPDFNQAINNQGHINHLKMALVLGRTPIRTLAFARNLQFSMAQLKKAFHLALSAKL